MAFPFYYPHSHGRTMNRNRRCRHAFTLVELLVVIAIIGILIGMLLPAVQQVREAARRVTCGNNIRQLTLAMHIYETSHKNFPPGLRNDLKVVPDGYQEGTFGWGTFILPFVEQGNLYNILSPNRGNMGDRLSAADKSAVAEALITPIAGFRCPSDDAEERSLRSVPGVTGGLALSNYVANNGSGRIMWMSIDPSVDSKRVTGPFDGTGGKRISTLTDGTSNTILLSERIFLNGPISPGVSNAVRDATPGAANIFGAKGLGHDVGATDEVKNFGMADVAFCGSGLINDFDGFTKRKAASSRHPGGVQMSYADGSVHFISEEIEQGSEYAQIQSAAYKRLLSMNDGLVVGDF